MKQRRMIHLLVIVEGICLLAAILVAVVVGFRKEEAPAMEPQVQRQEEPVAEEPEPEPEPEPEEESVTEQINDFSGYVEISEEASQQLQEMSTEEKAAQLFLVTPEDFTANDQVTVAGAGTRDRLREYPIAGFVYSNWNYRGTQQITDMIYGAQMYAADTQAPFLFLLARGNTDDTRAVLVWGEDFEAESLLEALSGEDAVLNADPLRIFPQHQEEITEEMTCVQTDDLMSGTLKQLREEASYAGLIVTPDLALSPEAGEETLGERVIHALQSGAELIYLSQGFEEAYQTVLQAVQSGIITQQMLDTAVGHILTVKAGIEAPKERENEADTDTRPEENQPAEPQQPTEPQQPEEPQQPAEPQQPEEPQQPAEPQQPEEPDGETTEPTEGQE